MNRGRAGRFDLACGALDFPEFRDLPLPMGTFSPNLLEIFVNHPE